MFDEFGKMDLRRLNEEAERMANDGDEVALGRLAAENGIPIDSVKAYINMESDYLCEDVTDAALGRIDIEADDIGAEEFMADWADYIRSLIIDSEEFANKVMNPTKSFIGCVGQLAAFAVMHAETPREDIRELKRLQKMPETHEGFENIVRNFFGQHHGILERLEKLIKSGAQEKELIEAVSPSGNKAHRKDGAMIFLMENVVKFKRAGHSPEEVQWEELFDVAKKMIEEEAENDAPAAVAERQEEREEEPEREPEKVEEAPEEAEEGPEVEERTAEGTAEDDEEADESQDRDDQEDVGGSEDEECGDGEHVEGDDAEKTEEICEDDAQETAPDEEPEEEFDGSMNPPVDNSEIAPAQKPDSFSKTLNEKGSEKIVDEQGKPSPERMSFKEYSRLIGEAEATCDKIRKEISESADWDAALKRLGKLENLLKTLKAEDDDEDEKE